MPQMALADEPAIVQDAGSGADAASIIVDYASNAEPDDSTNVVPADGAVAQSSVSEAAAAQSTKSVEQPTEPSEPEVVEGDRPDWEAADGGASPRGDDEGLQVKDDPAPELQTPSVAPTPKLKTPTPSTAMEEPRDIEAELENSGGKVTVNSLKELNAAITSKYSGHKSIYLGADIDADQLDVNGDVTLYGEGWSIKPRGKYVFRIANGATLNLGAKDYSNTLAIKGTNGVDPLITVGKNGELVMWDGVTLADNNIGSTGGGVALQDGGRFVMNGGAITNCASIASGGGGAVTVGIGSFFTMNGGLIENCWESGAGYTGGAVYVSGGKFEMNGGAIRGCQARSAGGDLAMGGGVGIGPYAGHPGSFVMNGGVIAGCSAQYGGGIYSNASTVELNGGSIDGNHASIGYGGGLFAHNGSKVEASKGGVVIEHNSAPYGGGVFLQGVDGPSNLSSAIICNNSASVFASDVYSNRAISLHDAKNMKRTYEADGAGKLIDGWYEDYPRYQPMRDPGASNAFVDDFEGGAAVVASYRIKPALVITLDGEDTSATYDGKSHAPSFSVASCTVDSEEKDASGIVNGAKFCPQDAVATSGPEGRRAFTDAGTYLVDTGRYVTISVADLASLLGDHADDYDVSFVVRKPAKVAIAKRKVVITTGSASKRQDGTELSSGDYHIGGDGFVDGEFDPKGAIRTTGSQTAAGSSDNTFEVAYMGGDGLPEDYLANYEIEPHLGKLEVVSADEPDPTPAAPDGPRGDQEPSDAAPSMSSDQAELNDAGAPVARQGTYVPKHMKAASAQAVLPQTDDPAAESGPRSLAAALAGAFLTALGALGLRRRDS